MTEQEKVYVYRAAALLDDGSEVLLDLEERGWADKAMLARTVRFNLLPKDGHPDYPVVVVNVPKNAKPVFRSKVYRSEWKGYRLVDFRCYAVGYKQGRTTHLAWVMPGGHGIEMAEDHPWLADCLFESVYRKNRAEVEAALAAEAEKQRDTTASTSSTELTVA